MKHIRKLRTAAVSAAVFISSAVITFAADDTEWYQNNAYLLSNNTVIKSALRTMGWLITRFLCWVGSIAGVLYDSTFGLIDATRYSKINNLINEFKPVLLALIVLGFAYLGISMIMDPSKKPPLLRNIVMAMLAVTVSLSAFSTLNTMAFGFKDYMIGDVGKNPSPAYEYVNNNIYDLVLIDKRNKGAINNLNFAEGTGFNKKSGLTGANIKDEKSLLMIDINETLNFKDPGEGKDLYEWSDTLDGYLNRKLIVLENGKAGTRALFDGVLTTTIGNEFYYRYTVNYLACWMQLIAYTFMLIALSYKSVRIMYELVVARILAYLHAADVASGERLKQILLFIRDTYIVLGISVLSVKLYGVLVAYAGEMIDDTSLTGIGRALLTGFINLFIAFCVIDGPNIAERILGMDAGLGRSMARTMGAFAAARGIGRSVGTAGKNIFNKAKGLSEKAAGSDSGYEGSEKGGSSAVNSVTAGSGTGKSGRAVDAMNKAVDEKAAQGDKNSKGLPMGYGEEEAGGQKPGGASAAKEALDNISSSSGASASGDQTAANQALDSQSSAAPEFMDGSGGQSDSPSMSESSRDFKSVDFMEKGSLPEKPKTEHIPEHRTVSNSRFTSKPPIQKLNGIDRGKGGERRVITDNSKVMSSNSADSGNGSGGDSNSSTSS